jgi:hypothetical protein
MGELVTAVQAMNLVMRAVAAIGKRDRNLEQGYSFRGVDAVVNAVGPALREHGVVVVPLVDTYEYGTVEVGRNRTPMAHARVTVNYRFYGPDGSYIEARSAGEAMDSGDKATTKAMSVSFRTVLLQALALPTDEPDADAHSYERSPAQDPEAVVDPNWSFDDLLTQINSARYKGHLLAIGRYAEKARDTGRLSQQQFDALASEAKKKIEELDSRNG